MSETAVREEILSFCNDAINPGARERVQDSSFSRDLWKKCGDMRLQGLVVPVTDGGAGFDALKAVSAFEALGYACDDTGLSFALCAHQAACVIPLLRHGSPALREKYLAGMSDGRLVAANAMTERDSGSDVFAMTTTATADRSDFIIDGEKTFVSNAPVADLIVVYAVTAEGGFHGGITAFLVPVETAGVFRSNPVRKMSLGACLMSDVRFDNARVSRDCVIGEVGGGSSIFSESMEWERVMMSALHVGMMQRILERCVAHARKRKPGGEPISRHQAVSHRIADMKVGVEASRLLTRDAAAMLGRTRQSSLHASIAKLFVSERLVEASTDLIRTLGGYGIVGDEWTERLLADAMASTVYSGTSDIQRNIIARWLGL